MHAVATHRPWRPQAADHLVRPWQNFGGERPSETQGEIIRRAFDRGIPHFDLANNYGPPYGCAEQILGRIFAADLAGRLRRS